MSQNIFYFIINTMPRITDLSLFLETTVLKNESGFQYKLGLPIIPQTQRGQVCKLNALSVVLNSLHQFRDMPQPLPIRKNKGQYTDSLRKHAKEDYGSQVGEIYSASTLAALAADNGFINSSIYTENQFEHYVERIISAINKDEAPIIFYDIDPAGEPAYFSSNREHAVVVAGYFISKERELCFIISQWGKYYWAKAENVFSSTSQLLTSRTPEKFFKYESGWCDVYSMRFLPPEFFTNPPSQQRQAQEVPKEGGLKNKILVIHNSPKSVNEHSFWSTTSLSAKESEHLFREDLIRKNIPHTTF
ncbi:hypothetical protein [Fluoribacter dumoffii]|uniref:Peptidase C39-like domain-containing protein n=1 Tax=Fluoribacter dumoffii TaxID=463 RepID=A0A377GDR3_9GAMM|nr:hypothetical protein [Fluoribacter dumoffii]KTC91249.1 hypothetical protein Ldum_2317 [Fluoribacter dumoffii NY 23]STO22946.1 Uncharacterised protein [Fluoribacter dumoffii]